MVTEHAFRAHDSVAKLAEILNFLVQVFEAVDFARLLYEPARTLLVHRSRLHGHVVLGGRGCRVEHVDERRPLLRGLRRFRLSAKLQDDLHQFVISRQRLIRHAIMLQAALRTLAALGPGCFKLGDAALLADRVAAHRE